MLSTYRGLRNCGYSRKRALTRAAENRLANYFRPKVGSEKKRPFELVFEGALEKLTEINPEEPEYHPLLEGLEGMYNKHKNWTTERQRLELEELLKTTSSS